MKTNQYNPGELYTHISGSDCRSFEVIIMRTRVDPNNQNDPDIDVIYEYCDNGELGKFSIGSDFDQTAIQIGEV